MPLCHESERVMEYYLLAKALHIISFTAWMAGMFYLPRLFAYHAGVSKHSSENLLFKVMERRLYYGIMMPAATLTILLGFWLMTYNLSGYLAAGWFQSKLFLVGGLLIYHLHSGYLRKVFAEDQNTYSPLFYRVYNEVAVLFLIGIVILVVVKP